MHRERSWAGSKICRICGQSSREGNHARQFTWGVVRVGLHVDVGVYVFVWKQGLDQRRHRKGLLDLRHWWILHKRDGLELCSTAFIILECKEGTGRIVGSFPESSQVANAYRGGPDGNTLDTVGSKQGLAKIRRQGKDLFRLFGGPAEDHVTAPA